VKLFEHEAKKFFRKYGIPTPRGGVAGTADEAARVAEAIGGPVAVKSQLLVGGRGKAGGIRFADTPEEAVAVARALLGTMIRDLEVRNVLVEEKLAIEDEIYAGVAVDRRSKSYVVLVSSEGGIDIEDVAARAPEKIVRHAVDPLSGLSEAEARSIAEGVGYSGSDAEGLGVVLFRLYRVAYEMDAELTEINPLAYVAGGFVAADARLNIDDNALFRHPELAERSREAEGAELTLRELEARRLGLTYVELDGNIGIIGNGAGLTMATLDTVTLQGGRPANFLDLGGGASAESISRSVEFVLSDPRVRALFVNILGGITRCDETARGVIEARGKAGAGIPIVVRLMGTNEEEGRQLLAEAGMDTLDTMEEAARAVVAQAEAS
jgi:succinyl-CoA synthetase beta subunit